VSEPRNTEPCIILCAPNGARRSKADHPALPITPDELACCADSVLKAGASILHLHVRNSAGGHTLDVNAYERAISAIRERVGDDLIIQITTESVGLYSPDQQMAIVRALKPEAVSVALREILPDPASDQAVKEFFHWMRHEAVFPQVILYDDRDLMRFEQALDSGLFGDAAPFVLFVAGKYGATPSPHKDIFAYFADKVDGLKAIWAVCSFGLDEYGAVSLATRKNGHIRVGFENNLWRPDGQLAGDNTELVARARAAIEATGRTIATASDVRHQLGQDRVLGRSVQETNGKRSAAV